MSPRTLLLPSHVHETLVSRAENGAPAEMCGVLLGTGRESDPVRVVDTSAVPNVADEPRTRYELDPGAVAQVFASVEGEGESSASTPDEATGSTEVVGFYHSHPRGPPGPSATDRAQAQWPGYVYVIVSLTTDRAQATATEAVDADPERESADVGAWRWTGEVFESLTVEVRGDGSDDGDDPQAG